jgi:hypothetical protein
MLSLWLALGIAAASLSVHQWLHKDAQSRGHCCVVAQLSKGHLFGGSAGGPALAPPPATEPLRLSAALQLPVSPDYRLALSRAPPAFLSSIRVVG